MSLIIQIQVSREDTGQAYADAYISNSWNNQKIKTNSNGFAAIIYPYESGSISLYINGICIFDGYATDAAKNGVFAKIPWYNW